jgi:hypothetical protein
MTADAPSPWHPENEVERLLCSLAGVVSARVVANPLGRLDEIHVLSSPALSPKQVVRNVESALSAGLGIVVDRRIISVAQIRRDAIDPLGEDEERAARAIATQPVAAVDAAPTEPVNAPGPPTPTPQPTSAQQAPRAPAPPRFVFVGYDTRHRTNAETECRVTVRRDDETFTGTGVGASTLQGRALAGARAVMTAIAAARGEDDLGLEGATVVETHGRSYVLVAVHALAGRDTQPLTGVAAVRRSPEESAILAALQATNRWTGADD